MEAGDTHQLRLLRMANHFSDEGLYVKEGYCLELIELLNEQEKPKFTDCCDVSHVVSWVDSSHYEHRCDVCGQVDTPSGWGKLREPCSGPPK